MKKADVVAHPEMVRHVGLLSNEPPGLAELPFMRSSDDSFHIPVVRLRHAECKNDFRRSNARGFAMLQTHDVGKHFTVVA
jgi:hypothetical protein